MANRKENGSKSSAEKVFGYMQKFRVKGDKERMDRMDSVCTWCISKVTPNQEAKDSGGMIKSSWISSGVLSNIY